MSVGPRDDGVDGFGRRGRRDGMTRKRRRKSLSPRTRFEIFKRDSFTCQYCGRTPPQVTLEVDHILPVAAGGLDETGNLLTACTECNAGKSDRQLTTAPEAIDKQLLERRDRAEQLREYNKFLLEAREEATQQINSLGVYWNDRVFTDSPGKYTFGPDRAASVRRFLGHLPAVEMFDYIDLAFAKLPPHEGDDRNTFRYFCGCCWKRIRPDNEEDF